jgi:hypothetical protein
MGLQGFRASDHRWATGGWPPATERCKHCNQTREEAASLEHLQVSDPPRDPLRWGCITRLMGDSSTDTP